MAGWSGEAAWRSWRLAEIRVTRSFWWPESPARDHRGRPSLCRPGRGKHCREDWCGQDSPASAYWPSEVGTYIVPSMAPRGALKHNMREHHWTSELGLRKGKMQDPLAL